MTNLTVLETDLLNASIDVFVHPPDYESSPDWSSELGVFITNDKKFTCGQFIRRFVDKRYQHWTMPRHLPRAMKRRINSQAETMGQIWRNIRLLPFSRVSSENVVLFYQILLEETLVFCDRIYEGEDSKSVTNRIKDLQKINRGLEALENPFNQSTEPATWTFIELARREARMNDDFYLDYRKLIVARMNLTTVIRESQPKKLDQLGQLVEKRGRKRG